MIWLFVGVVCALSVVAVSRWARRTRDGVNAESEARRAQGQMDVEEARLLAKLRNNKDQ